MTATALQNRFDMFKSVGGIVGTAVSALFLFAIAVANVLVLISVYQVFHAVKNGGRFVEEDLNPMLAKLKATSQPRQFAVTIAVERR